MIQSGKKILLPICLHILVLPADQFYGGTIISVLILLGTVGLYAWVIRLNRTRLIDFMINQANFTLNVFLQ